MHPPNLTPDTGLRGHFGPIDPAGGSGSRARRDLRHGGWLAGVGRVAAAGWTASVFES